MDTASIRALDQSDGPAYVALLDQLDRESTFLLWEPGERTLTVESFAAQITAIDPVDRLRLVAAVDGELIGFLVCVRGGVRRIHHRCDFTMAVLNNYHGRGIGHLLIAAMETWAIEHGIERIELTVMAHNQRAISLYEQTGFVREGVKRAAIRVDGSPIDECVMGKTLAAAGPARRFDG